MIKKLIKWLCITLLTVGVLVGAGIFTLYKMYPPAKLKAMAQEYVAKNFHREISFEKISLTWIGFTLSEVALSENETFADGTFIKAKKLTAHVAVRPLLQKRVEISTIEADELNIQIIQKKDGSFNFDTLIPADSNASSQPASSTGNEQTPLFVTAEKLALNNCHIGYVNQDSGLRLELDDLNIQILRFDLNNPFEMLISFTTDVDAKGQPQLKLPVTLRAQINLAGLDFPNAYADLTEMTAKYKTIVFAMQGTVKNLAAPQVNLTGSLSGINNQVLAELAPDLPNFTLPAIYLTLQANADLQTSMAHINLAKLAVQNSSLTVGGTLNWAGSTPAYTVSGNLDLRLAELVQMTDTIQDFEPGGTIKGKFKATEKKDFTDVTANITLHNLSALYPPFTFTQTQGTLVINSLDQISSPGITGKLNAQNFKTSFSYQKVKEVLNLVFNLNLDKLVLDRFPASSTAQPAQSAAPAAGQTSQSNTRMNIRTQVTVGGLQIPYVQSDGFNLTAQLTDVTDSMAQTNGTVQFALNPGQITHLDDFIKENKVAKIILLPVALVKKVAELLKVDLFPTDKTGNGTTIAFTKAEGSYSFTNGMMNVNTTTFNSSLTDISASGTANFKTDELNMKATATLLTQAAPLSFKITGTINEPKGKLDVINTVGSVVGNLLNGKTAKSVANEGASVTKNTAQTAEEVVAGTVNTAADVVKGIGSLFKKKEK